MSQMLLSANYFSVPVTACEFGLFKVIECHQLQFQLKAIYDLVSVIYSNLSSICHRFQNIVLRRGSTSFSCSDVNASSYGSYSYFAVKTVLCYLQSFCHNSLALQTDDTLWRQPNSAMLLQHLAKTSQVITGEWRWTNFTRTLIMWPCINN